MATIKGYLNEIKGEKTKQGFGPYFKLVVDGKFYETGSKFPPKGVAQGDYITFETAQNARGYETIVQGSVSKTDAPAGLTPAASAAAAGPDRQDIISRQAAFNTAISFVGMLAANGGVPEGKTTTAAAKAEKLEALVLSYMPKFYRWSTGNEFELPEDDVVAAAAPANWAEQE